MTAPGNERLWDFSSALELINTLTPTPTKSTPANVLPSSSSVPRDIPRPGPQSSGQSGLGDFSSVWRYLDASSSLPSRHGRQISLLAEPSLNDYKSDGAVYTSSVVKKRKSIQWRDEAHEGTLTDVAPDTSATDEDWTVKKSPRRRRNGIGESSETELGPRRTPARKASLHSIGTKNKPKTKTNDAQNRSVLQQYLREQYGYDPEASSPRRAREPVAVPASPQTVMKPTKILEPSPRPVSTKDLTENAKPLRQANRHRDIIEPKFLRSGEDRHWALLLKIIDDFYPDRASLVRPANLTTHSIDPRGIHVFVDASNIFIGFHDQLKRARAIAATARVPRVNMSFDSLALLLERRRPVAKRVLCGSRPHVPAFDVAQSIGYECSILDKVLKARELTDRQKYFYKRSAGCGDSPPYNSGPDDTPTHAPQKMVEQGVDEILHLKILESLVDNDLPSTIVLATGDAAQAEYSQGFMVMVERALRKGWNVELVSWKSNISQMYKKASFAQTWASKFRIVELDSYAEELLDM